jgi:hypothetical protein
MRISRISITGTRIDFSASRAARTLAASQDKNLSEKKSCDRPIQLASPRIASCNETPVVRVPSAQPVRTFGEIHVTTRA